MKARYLFQQDKHYDVSYDTGDKVIRILFLRLFPACSFRPQRLFYPWTFMLTICKESKKNEDKKMLFFLLFVFDLFFLFKGTVPWDFLPTLLNLIVSRTLVTATKNFMNSNAIHRDISEIL